MEKSILTNLMAIHFSIYLGITIPLAPKKNNPGVHRISHTSTGKPAPHHREFAEQRGVQVQHLFQDVVQTVSRWHPQWGNLVM